MADSDEYKSRLVHGALKAQARFGRVAAPAFVTTVLAGRLAAGTDTKGIERFIRKYKIDYTTASRCSKSNTAIGCASKYADLNDFFTRKLHSIRVDASPLVSPATCKAVLYDTFQGSKVWVKGSRWSSTRLLRLRGIHFPDFAVGLFRLAPADYHRFHAPMNAVVKSVRHLRGGYLSVDPIVVRSTHDVFTENRRAVVELESPIFGLCYFVAVGAAGVGSVLITKDPGDTVRAGDELGYFEFGGSTVVVLIPNPTGISVWDPVITTASDRGEETRLQVGQNVFPPLS
jgi:phosphatidylserine decarboxylase